MAPVRERDGGHALVDTNARHPRWFGNGDVEPPAHGLCTWFLGDLEGLAAGPRTGNQAVFQDRLESALGQPRAGAVEVSPIPRGIVGAHRRGDALLLGCTAAGAS